MGSSRCGHISTLGDYTEEDILPKRQSARCDTCGIQGQNMWVCLHHNCLYVGCGEAANDDSTHHFKDNLDHCLTLNLTSLRVWCYKCEAEVYLENNTPAVPAASRPIPGNNVYVANGDADTDDEIDGEDHNLKPRGLTGLQNIGNTCYMNAAIQALSNCPPLTQFFLQCGSYVRTDKKPGLSKNYMKLMCDMWHKKRPSYVVPSNIAYGIKFVCPMFRGYTQQDSQEFLRCFMDQLHEELKEPVVDLDKDYVTNMEVPNVGSVADTDESSQSEAEYETCDSGLSSEKSSYTDEGNEQVESTRLCKKNHHQGVGGSRKSLVDGLHSSYQSLGDEDNGVETATITETKPTLKSQGSMKGFSPYLPFSQGWASSNPSNSAGKSKRKRQIKHRSVVSDVFDGKILSSVQCLTCDRVSSTKETFQDLSLPIPNREYLSVLHASQTSPLKASLSTCTDVYSHQGWFSWMFGWMRSWIWGPTVSLQDCLAAFFSADELKGDNMYSCEKCKKLRNGVKYSKVLELPEVLCIHLKRFRHEVMFSSKINSYVSFPLEELDMTPFLHKDCPSAVCMYELVAVICHHGTAGGGHYTAFALNYINDRWYEFDDQCVTAVDPQTVANCEAYVLFYRKSSEDMMKKRQRAIELMESGKRDPSLMHFYVSKQWVNKFNTFAEPGPINNTDFLCPHGGVHPSKASYVEELCTQLSQGVWEYLHDTFGGGPACNQLYICALCQQEQELLERRQNQELDEFIRLHKEFPSQEMPGIIYAISLNWFRQWEMFVRNRATDPPGPIDNSTISFCKNGQIYLRTGSDHAQLTLETWQFLHSIYGGGPEVTLQQQGTVASVSQCFLLVPNLLHLLGIVVPMRCDHILESFHTCTRLVEVEMRIVYWFDVGSLCQHAQVHIIEAEPLRE